MATYYWVGGSGTWNNANAANWSLTTGGTGGAGVPTNVDTVNFDANSGTSATVTVASTATALNVTINKSDINLSLSGNVTLANASVLTLTTGTITLNNNILTVAVISSPNGSARTIAFGTGSINVIGVNTTIANLGTTVTYSGTPVVNCTGNGTTGTRSVTLGAYGVSLNVTAGTDTFSMGNLNGYLNVDFTGFSGTLANTPIYFKGNFKLSSTMTVAAGANGLFFVGTSGTQQITTNGKTIDCPITFDGVGGTFQLQDALTIGSTRALTLTNGTFDAANKNVTIGSFALGAGTKTLTLGSGTWTCAGAWDSNTNVTGLTVTASTATIAMNSASSKTFSGGAKTWPTLQQAGAGALTIAQSNTFTDITASAAGRPSTVTLTAGTTQTVSQFTLSGSAGNLITLNTTAAGSKATLSDASGTNAVSYMSIKDTTATGGAGWDAYTSSGNVNAGNNTGWVFDAIPSTVSIEFYMDLRSFTEPRRF